MAPAPAPEQAPAPAPEQGLQNFSAPIPARSWPFSFMAATPAPFDLNFAGFGSNPALLRTKHLL